MKANNKCAACASNQHVDCDKTFGACFVCKSKDHTAILCPKKIEEVRDRCKEYKKAKKTTTGNVCYFNGTEGSSHLLPVIKLRLGGHSDSSKYFNFFAQHW